MDRAAAPSDTRPGPLGDTIGGPVAGFHSDHGVADRATACRWRPSPRGRHARARLQPRPLIDERYRALDAAFGGVPHRLHYAIKANATLARRPPDARSSARAPTPTPAARSRWRCGRASRPTEIVFTGVGKTRAELERAIGAGRGRHQRRVARRNRSHRGDRRGRRPRGPRRGSHQSGRRCRQPPAHFDRARAPRSSACRSPTHARCSATWRAGRGCASSACTSTSDRRSRRPEPLARAARGASRIWRGARRRGHSARAPRRRRRPGHRVSSRSGRDVRRSDYAAAVLAEPFGDTGLTLVLEPGRWIVGAGRRAGARRSST